MLLVFCASPLTAYAAEHLEPRPNVIFIFADDLGYGEIEVLDPDHAKISTPNLNQLAAEGQIYTDAHTSSSVCTPSRYSLLTGRYAWRTRLQQSVLNHADKPLIAQGRMTLGSLFHHQGYNTAIFGKWHLGFTFNELKERGAKRPGNIADGFLLAPAPIGTRISGGPLTYGFDTYFGFHHARSMSSVIRNNEIIEEIHPIEMLPRLNHEISNYIDEKANESKTGKPFFIYFPQNSPHSPIVPSKRWQNRTGLGNYADFVAQTDDSVGVVLDALDRNGIRDNTIVVFSTDNGSSRHSNATELRAAGHRPSGPFRGKKASLWDGGHRVPFILRWPARVEGNTTIDRLVCLTDVIKTFAEMLSVALPDKDAEDSISFLPAIYGKPDANPRDLIVHHDIGGHFSIRKQHWKLLLKKQGRSDTQLYDLSKDLGETENLAGAYPKKVTELLTALDNVVILGRSTPGQRQTNDVAVVLWKDQESKKEIKNDSRNNGLPNR